MSGASPLARQRGGSFGTRLALLVLRLVLRLTLTGGPPLVFGVVLVPKAVALEGKRGGKCWGFVKAGSYFMSRLVEGLVQ